VDWLRVNPLLSFKTMYHFRLKNALTILILFVLTACGSSGSDPEPIVDPLDRAPMLTHWVDNIILPSYDKFKVKWDAFASASAAFTAAPSETSLGTLRQTWVDAYVSWAAVELFEVGPADKYTIRSFFNIYPADENGIKQNFSNPDANLGLPASYAQQGFPALDYLINGIADSAEGIVGLYTTDPGAAGRVAYLKKLTDRMTTLLGSVISEWNGGYRETFISKTGLDIGSPTALMVNNYVLHYERFIRSGKFGIPSGAMAASGGVKYPEKVEAYYKRDISLTLAKICHQTSVDFFNGKNVKTGESGPSFKSYLDALEAKDNTSGVLLSEIINTQFGVVVSKLNGLTENLYQQVQTNNQPMIDTYTEMQKMVRMLKVDMTSAMSVTITYTDNDGD